MMAKLRGKPVICAAMYFSCAFKRLASEMEVMLNASVNTITRTSSAVSCAFHGS